MFEEVSPKVSLQSKMADFNRLRRQKNISPRKQIISLLVVAVITGSSFFFAQRLTKPVSNPKNSSAAGLSTVNIMNVYYFPPDSQYANNQIRAFQKSLAAKVYIENASAYHADQTKKMISFNDTDQYIRSTARPAGTNGFEVVRAILNDTQNGLSICQLIEQKRLDQIWIWADPDKDPASVTEWEINNVTSNYGSSTIYSIGSLCSNTRRTFSFLNLAYNVPVTNAVHSFAHYMEGLITGIEGYDMLAGRFRGTESVNGQNAKAYAPYAPSDRCGSVHVPPNVPLDPATNLYLGYQYNLPNVVSSSCANWNPDGTGTKTPVSVETWRAVSIPSTTEDSELQTFNSTPQLQSLDQLKYLTWWLQQFPHESAGIMFEGKKMPSWWSFVSNTDDVISAYQAIGGYWFKPDLVTPVAVSQTASCSSTSGVTSNCTYTPGSSVLGATDENLKVLGTSTYGDLALVSVHYAGSLTNPDVRVTSVTYCGEPMTNVTFGKTEIGTPQTGDGMRAEMWFKSLPKSGVCPVVTTFSTDPGQRVVSTTIFNNIDTVSPLAGSTYAVTMQNNASSTPGNMNMSMSGPKDSVLICGYSLFPGLANPPGNSATLSNTKSLGLLKFENSKIGGSTSKVWAGIAGYSQRTTAGSFDSIVWQTTKTTKWSGICTNLSVKPFPPVFPPVTTPNPTIAPTVTPTVRPTTTPVPTVAPTATPIPTSAPTTYLLVPKNQIVATATSQHVGYEAPKSLDTLTTTFWHSEWSPYAALPQHVLLTLPNVYKVGKIGYLPRQDGSTYGNITGYKILVSADGITNTVAAQGTWADDQTLKSVEFTPINAKYVAVVATSGNGGYASAAELAVWYVGTPATATPVPTATPAPTVTPSTAPTTLYAIPQYTMAVAGTSQQAGYEANKVLDVNSATLWHSAWSPYAALPQWLTFTLPSLSSVAKIEYLPRQDGGINGNITSYYVLASADGLTNTVVAQGTWADDQTLKSVSFTPFKAKYIALVVTAGHGNYASASEINIYKTEAPVITATATSSHVGYEPSKAIDQNSVTMWHSDWNPYFALPQSITLNLGTQRRVSQISYAPRQDGSTAGLITSYKIYTSTNGITFTLVTSGTWASDFTTKTATFTTTTATHIKLEAVVGGLGYASASEVYIPQIVGGPFPINVTGK